MSLAMFAGVVTGVVIALLAGFVAMIVKRRKGEVQDDERTQVIKGRAAEAAVWVTGVILFVGWVIDNLTTYSNGGVIRFFTPWSIMLLVLLSAFKGTYAYFYHKHSADETDPAALAEKRRVAATNLLLAGCMVVLSSSPAVLVDAGLRYMLLGMAVVQVALSLFTLRRQLGRTRVQ
jgi:uncharacterized membrane protein